MIAHSANPTSNDNMSIFDEFMLGYWNQMSPDIYGSLEEALVDFRESEGETRFTSLIDGISALLNKYRFPPISRIEEAYKDPFWLNYDRIITLDEFDSCEDLFPNLKAIRP